MEGKKRYVAIVLFLLIGLTLFAFANPISEERKGSNKENENGKTPSEVSENQGDKDKETNDGNLETEQPVINQDGNNNQGQTGNTGNNHNTDNTYANALAAVEAAEKTLATVDAETARNLVNLVTNQTQKNELSERVDIIEESIDAITLVEKLEKLVNDSKTKANLDESRDYRTDEQVVEKVENLRNKTVQSDLQDRLTTLAKLLDDETNPVITGITNNETTKEDVSISIEDENEVTVKVTLNGKEIENAASFTESGVYEVTVVDAAYNETTLTFTIDKIAPKFDGLTSGGHYKEIAVNVIDDTDTTITVKNMDTGVTTEVNAGTVLTEEATYYITATDKAGNQTSIWVAIDNTAPKISGVDETNPTSKNEIVYVSDKFLTSVVIDGKEYTRADFECGSNNENFTFQKKVTSEGTHTVIAKDKFGNTTTVTFVIDKTAPTIAGVEEGKYYTAPVTPTVTDKTALVLTLNGNNYVSGTEIAEDGNYTLVATDAAGNKSEVSFIVDKTAPAISVKANGSTGSKYVYQKLDFTITVTETNLDKIYYQVLTSNKPTDIDTTKVKEAEYVDNGNGTYTINFTLEGINNGRKIIVKALDKAGNSKVTKTDWYHFDNTAPEAAVTKSNQDKSTNKDVTVTLVANEEIQTPEGFTKVDGKTYTKVHSENGKFEVVITDRAGNKATVKYEVKRIDKVAPEAKVTKSNQDKSTNKDVTVTLVANEAIYTPEGWTEVKTNKEHEFTKVYSENGKYEVVITDKAGNKTTVKFEVKRIDKVAPEATVTKSNKDGSTNKDVTVTLVANEAIYTPEGWTEVKTNKEHEFTKVYSENGKYEVVITDKAGNKTTVKFEVKRIDKVAPELTIVEKEEYQLEVNSEYVEKGYSAYDVVDKDVTNLVKKSYEFQAKDQETWEKVESLDTSKLGTYKITYTAYDKSGNTATDSRLVKIVDTTAPVVTANLDENGNKDIYVEAGSEYVELGATVTDNYDKTWVTMKPAYINRYEVNNDGSVGAFDKRLETTTIDTKVVGKYLVVYQEKDSNGNVSDSSLLISKRWVTVQDKTPATIVLPYTEGLNKNEMRVEAGTKVTVDDVVAKVTDNVDPETTIKPYKAVLFPVGAENNYNYDFTNGFDTKYVGRYNLYYEYIDQAGNKSTACMLLVIKDKTAPVAELDTKNSVGKNGVYSKVVIKVTDNAYLDRYVINGGPVSTITNLTTEHGRTFIGGHLKEGKNTIAVYDKAGNCSNVIEFTYDATAPTVSENNYLGSNPYRGMSFKLHDNNAVDYYVINGTKKDVTDAPWSDANYSNIERYLVNGENTLVVYDIAGNAATHAFTLDREAPVAVLDTNGSVGTDGVYSKVVIKVTDNAYLDRYEFNGGPYGSTITNLTTSHSRTFIGGHLKEGKNTIAVYDKAGNRSNVIEFTHDLTAPTAEVTTSNNGALTNSDVTATLTASEALQEIEGWTKVNDTTFTKAYSADGTYEVTIKDKAGNTATVNVTIAGIDKVAPVFAGVENNGLSNGPVTLTITEDNLKEVKVNNTADADFLNAKSKEFTTPGTYTVVATDLAGNSTTHTFTITVTNAADLATTLKNSKDHKVVLGSDITLNKTLNVTLKKYTIDLNGHNIIIPETMSIQVRPRTTITVTGNGKIVKQGTDNAAFVMYGSGGLATSRTSILNIEKGVTVEGDTAIAVNGSSYMGVEVNVDGHLKAGAYALYVNGTAKRVSAKASPLFNLNENAVIEATANGIYGAGYAIWNVNGATIKGANSGIAIKSGILNVNSGTIRATGADTTPTEGWSNGVNASGAAIQIESNTGYKGQMEINIAGGNIVSDNGVSIYEYLASGTTATSVKSLKVTGGNFTAGATKANVLVSEQFGNTIGKFITGGTFNADPSNFVADGHTATLDNGSYKVA